MRTPHPACFRKPPSPVGRGYNAVLLLPGEKELEDEGVPHETLKTSPELFSALS